MLGTSSGLPGSSGNGATTSAAAHEGEGGGGGATEGSGGSSVMVGIGEEDNERGDDVGYRSPAGNRWPRQETLTLLKIRSDMDAIFRDSTLKGPLWEEVSRKMAELGYHRSGKKCKEKFENMYKYHKRTKDGRVGKSEAKTYRFFDQLEALDNHPSPRLPLPPPPVHEAVPVSVSMPPATVATAAQTTVPLITPTSVSIPHSHQINPINPTPTPPTQQPLQPQPGYVLNQPHPLSHMSSHPIPSSLSSSPSSSSSTSSDKEILGRRKRKRKWKYFFERLINEVTDKQKELQKKFFEAIEKREHDRMVREEAWKLQEVARLNREQEILSQERSMAAAKDAALITFLQKLSEQQQIPLPLPFSAELQGQNQTNVRPSPSPSPAAPPQQSQPQAAMVQEAPSQPPPKPPPELPPAPSLSQLPPPHSGGDAPKTSKEENLSLNPVSSSRWPKAEVQVLIKLRTCLDQKYQEGGPKGPLWEEISASMRKLGYNRNAKRCKEKWENINKYFKKVKESNKKRPEYSKTCPYFHELDALYREKNKLLGISFNPNNGIQPLPLPEGAGSMAQPIMALPEQQWPLPLSAEDPGSDSVDTDQEEDDDNGEEDEDDDQGYEVVGKINSAASAGVSEAGGTAAAAMERTKKSTSKIYFTG
ncbi:hypothetical protein Nepgr_018948 [Nepenthes gracilis]|uniref:Myb-like domain-containing protein n=1 Tax=Nepenthes gracilis TaxID=150966 RepID=A0AAD3SU47_NEPGR|nr:hypothetical protein Nepgr_018948 [Nepenthes gracilis]